MKKLLQSIVFAAFAFLTLSAEECGESHYISDSGFDLWCGDSLCNWELESGTVARAASWHKEDYAVELLGNDVVISQLSTKSSTTCLRFEMLADIEDDARLTLNMDFYDDGVVDYSQEVGHVRWESVVYLVATPATWSGVRFTLHKEGTGRARLAQIEATADTACIDKPIELPNKPLGAACEDGAECATGTCSLTPSFWFGKVCGTCEEDTDCELGQVCGVGGGVAPFLGLPRACVAEASNALGSVCVSNQECAAGACCQGRCSECCDATDCPSGDSCAPVEHDLLTSSLLPSLCSSDSIGSLCLSDADCQSGSCVGGEELKVCAFDGRDCTTNADCPSSPEPYGPRCLAIGIDAGTCQ